MRAPLVCRASDLRNTARGERRGACPGRRLRSCAINPFRQSTQATSECPPLPFPKRSELLKSSPKPFRWRSEPPLGPTLPFRGAPQATIGLLLRPFRSAMSYSRVTPLPLPKRAKLPVGHSLPFRKVAKLPDVPTRPPPPHELPRPHEEQRSPSARAFPVFCPQNDERSAPPPPPTGPAPLLRPSRCRSAAHRHPPLGVPGS